MKVAIIGGGAAGFFAAINVKENYPDTDVFIFEKTSKYLSKVKISGGGRCNVTNGETSIPQLIQAYPRGHKLLKRAFRTFSTKHTMEWFEKRGVPLVIQEDNCVFPKSQDSQTIINCFLSQTKKLGVHIKTNHAVKAIKIKEGKVHLEFKNLSETNVLFDKIIIATGGSPKRLGLKWLEDLGHEISEPVPSLFTFNMPSENIKELMGVVVNPVQVKIQGSKLMGDGPLLITHWGMSGPAILKLSSLGARILNEKEYKFNIQVNWIDQVNHEEVTRALQVIARENPKKQLSNFRPFQLPTRLWHFLIAKMELASTKPWGELGKKGIHKITTTLTNDVYKVNGKTTFKEEFVTCGGVSLNSIDPATMRSKRYPQLYFAGEVMDIDGITGGYNFQGAWTTAFIAAKLL